MMNPSPKAEKRSHYAGARYATHPGRAKLRTLDDLDKRTAAHKRAAAFMEDLAEDLGGWERITTAERALVEAAALIAAMISDDAAGYLSGQTVNRMETMSLVNAQRRTLEALGLQRRAVDVTPSIEDLIQGRAA